MHGLTKSSWLLEYTLCCWFLLSNSFFCVNKRLSFVYTRRIYQWSSFVGFNDFSKYIGSRMYKRSRLHTQLSTIHSHFLAHPVIPSLGQYVIIMSSFNIPCSLRPVVASLGFTGNCIISHLNTTVVLDIWWGRTFTSGLNPSGSIPNLWFSTRALLGGEMYPTIRAKQRVYP